MLKITNKGKAVLRPALATVCNLFNLVPREKGQKEHGAFLTEWIFLFKVLTRTLFELSLFPNPIGLVYPHPLTVLSQSLRAQRACSDSVVVLEINQAVVVF